MEVGEDGGRAQRGAAQQRTLYASDADAAAAEAAAPLVSPEGGRWLWRWALDGAFGRVSLGGVLGRVLLDAAGSI
eukprot:gene25419-biopygen13518